jgi:hypothetical protein
MNFENLESNDFPRWLVEKWPRRGDYTSLNMYFGGYDNPFSFALFPYNVGEAQNGFFPWDAVFILIYPECSQIV